MRSARRRLPDQAGPLRLVVTAPARLLSAASRVPVVGDVAFCGRSAAHLWGAATPAPGATRPRGAVHPLRHGPIADVARAAVDAMGRPHRRPGLAVAHDARRRPSSTSPPTVRRPTPGDRGTRRPAAASLGRRAPPGAGPTTRAQARAAPEARPRGCRATVRRAGPRLLYLRTSSGPTDCLGRCRSHRRTPGRRRRHDHEYTAYRLIVEVDGRLGHEQWADRVRDGQARPAPARVGPGRPPGCSGRTWR